MKKAGNNKFNININNQDVEIIFEQNFMMKRQGDLFDTNISNFQTPKHSKVLQDFYIKLQDSGKAKLLALVRTSLRDPKLDCVRLLAELSNEQNFDVTYVDIEERNANGEVQCLVQISTMPVAVCHGVGGDQSAANNAAARNALEYLKIMVKKSTTQNQGPKNGATDTNGTKVAGK